MALVEEGHDSIAHEHAYLPHGKDLYGNNLKKALEDMNFFGQYHCDALGFFTITMGLAPHANSNKTESFTRAVGSKNPKI